MSTDTSEQGLESLIVEAMTGLPHPSVVEEGGAPGGPAKLWGTPNR